MGSNKAELGVDENLVITIARLQRQIIELKTHPQPIGGDVLKTVSSQTVSVSFPLTAGTRTTGGFTWTLPKPFLTLFTPLLTVYVDGTTAADAFPYGANISGDKLNVNLIFTHDEALSDDVSGTRQYIFNVYNYGASSHTYTVKHRLNYPILPLN